MASGSMAMIEAIGVLIDADKLYPVGTKELKNRKTFLRRIRLDYGVQAE